MTGPLWVDGTAYCRHRLLGGAAVPWTDPGELASFVSRSAALLGTDAALIEVGDAWAVRAGDPQLAAAMARQPRRARPLRTLLDDEPARGLVLEALRTAVAAARLPVVAVLPSPGRWARQAAALAGLADTPPDEATVDAAAMYIAGALHGFADAGVATLLLDEADTEPADLPDPAGYEPILNVAAHLRLPVVVRTDRAPCWPRGLVDGVQAWIGSAPPAGEHGPWGLVLGFVETLPDCEGGGPCLVRVPATADPGEVVATVRSWRRESGDC